MANTDSRSENSGATRQILICDDDLTFHVAIKHALATGPAKEIKFQCRSAHNSDEALAIFKNHATDIVVLDVEMRSADEGLRLIPKLRELDPEIAIIMSSGRKDFETVKEAMRLGAWDYIPKEIDTGPLLHTLEQALERRQLMKRNHQQNFELSQSQKKHVMVGDSSAMQNLRRTVERMRKSQANVLITGETGVGKEVVARQLRAVGPDGNFAPFIAVDSATIQSSRAESILFGHEKGAFTGADKATKGIFEEAHGGIVYFDEIGNMPLEIQAKLLRVLQEKEVVRLGSSKPLELSFRVVCATNRNLDEMVRKGEFKDDLLQRLNVLPVEIPPLRERREDIPHLAQHLLTRLGLLEPRRFTDEALEALKKYSWPGNIRELSNVIAFVTTMSDADEIEVSDLPPKVRDAAREFFHVSRPLGAAESFADAGSFYEKVAAFEFDLLTRELQTATGNVSRMAIQLGMDRSHLYTKLKEHGLQKQKV